MTHRNTTTRRHDYEHCHVGDATIDTGEGNCAYANNNRCAVEEHHRLGIVPPAKRSLAARILGIAEQEVRVAAFG